MNAARFALREATAAWHERVDTVFSAADLATRDGYARFLATQAAAYLPVEAALDAASVEALLPDWPARRRADLLCADLAALGVAVPPLEPAPVLRGTPAMLGAVYVLEGSRLGGVMLKRAVPDDLPARFLGGGTSAMWQSLIRVIDASLATDEDRNAAIAAACDIFALFERSGRRLLESDHLGG